MRFESFLISFLTLKNLQRYYFDIKIKMEEEKLRLYLENPISPLSNCPFLRDDPTTHFAAEQVKCKK